MELLMNVRSDMNARIKKSTAGIKAAAKDAKHIALVAPLLAKHVTGLSSYVANLVPRLCDSGCRVTVLTTDCGYAGSDAGELVAIDSRAVVRLFHVAGRFNRRVCRSTEMVRWFRDNSDAFDVVDIQGIWNWVTADIARVCSDSKIPYVITPHGMMARWDWAKRPIAKRFYFRAIYNKSWESAAAVRVLSKGELENCMVPPRGHVAVIPNGIDIPEKMDVLSIARFKATLSVTDKAPVVLFLGRITPQKGVVELIQAFELVLRRCPNAILAIAGWLDGSYGKEVQVCAASITKPENIRFLGPVYGEMKAGLFAAASLFVTLSRNEGLPVAVLEALGYGIPAVLTVDSNIPEVSAYAAGVITNLDPAKVAEAIVELLLDEERRSAMAVNARHLAAEYFSWSATLPQLLSLYEQIANR